MSFGKKLKLLRIEKGYYQKQLAQLMNTELYNISNWEQGRAEPCLEDIRKLCIIFNISADELLEIETSEQRKSININNSFNNNSGKQNIKF